MMYQNAEVRIVQGENQSRSTAWSSQSCVNLYTEVQKSGRTPAALMPWPGEKAFSAGTVGTKTRGFRIVSGVPYVLIDRSLYSITSLGTQVYLADVPGNNLVSMADDGFNLIIRNSGTVAFINQKFVFAGNGATYKWTGGNERKLSSVSVPTLLNRGEFVSTQVDSTTLFNEIGEARLQNDDILQIFPFQKKIIMGGTRTIEIYYDDGGTPQPIVPIPQSSTNQIGVASKLSMAETADYLYMLGADGLVYRLANFDFAQVSTSAIAKELDAADKTNAQGFSCHLDGQWFYILQLPSDNLTMCFSEKTGEWGRLSTGATQPVPRHLIAGYGNAYGKRLVANSVSSDVYEWDFLTYKSNGNPLIRQFMTAPINGSALGAAGKRLISNKVRFIMQTGVGNSDEKAPQIMAQYSTDGGKTFSKEFWLDVEREGESTSLVDWYLDTTFYDIMFKVRVSDPVFTSFHSCSIELKPAGY